MSKNSVPQKLLPWLEAKRKFRLSDDHIQMARELDMKPSSLGKLDNTRDCPWKAPLPDFIEDCYFKRFKRDRPEHKIVWRPVKVPKSPLLRAAPAASEDTGEMER